MARLDDQLERRILCGQAGPALAGGPGDPPPPCPRRLSPGQELPREQAVLGADLRHAARACRVERLEDDLAQVGEGAVETVEPLRGGPAVVVLRHASRSPGLLPADNPTQAPDGFL